MLSEAQLTGRDQAHLVTLADGHLLHPAAAEAFVALQEEARHAGFELAIASSFRSFDRQLAIWNAKVEGARPVHDDRGVAVDMAALSPEEKLHAILRYSAMPGSSRHHWGCDLDVYDAKAIAADYQVQLSPAEVAPGGVFDALHGWLDEKMSDGGSYGFYRPYTRDTGGVAPERWHLSFAPLSKSCAAALTVSRLRACWDTLPDDSPLLLRRYLEASLPALFERYVTVPDGWCPAD